MMSFITRYWSGKTGTPVEEIRRIAEEELKAKFHYQEVINSDGSLHHRIMITYENTPDN
jgi:hypothetical protein